MNTRGCWLRSFNHKKFAAFYARRKFFDLHAANKRQLAEQALHSIGGLYEVERQAREMSDEDRRRIRQEKKQRRWRKHCTSGC